MNELALRKAAALAAGRPADEPALPGAEDTSYSELFTHLAAELENANTEMISANTTHLGQLARIVDLKGRRDGLTSVLSGMFLKARHTYETLFGSDQSRTLRRSTADPFNLPGRPREAARAFPSGEAPPSS